MASTFLRKVSNNIGNVATAVGSYTVSANTGAVVIGLTVANTSNVEVLANVSIYNGITDYYLVNRAPIPAEGSLVLIGGEQKAVLQANDSIRVSSTVNNSVDVIMTLLETNSIGISQDSGGGGGPTAAYDATDPTDFTFFAYGSPAPGTGEFDVIVDAGSALHTFLSTTDITGYAVDVYEGATVFSQTVISRTNPAAQYWQIKVTNFSTSTGTATRLAFFAP